MEYKPALPERNSNVSKSHPLRDLFILAVGALALLAAFLVGLGVFVDLAVRFIDPELEYALFGAFADDGEAQSKDEKDLQQLVDALGACIDVGYPVVAKIDETDELNAFAMPGGRIVVLSGLLDAVETENGLAFILAHELAHFKNRDHLRGMGRSLVFLAISVLVTGASSDLSAILTPVFNVEAAQHSQRRERAADEMALAALNCHYGHVDGATEFFEYVLAQPQGLEIPLLHYLSSHPQVTSRIADLKRLAAERGYSSG